MKQLITLRLLGFDDGERLKFESLLTIAENMLDIPWQLSDRADADYFLLKGSLKSQMIEDALLKTLSPEQCIFYSEHKTDGPFHEILVDRNNTPYLRSIVELFKNLTHNQCEAVDESSVEEAGVSESPDVKQSTQAQPTPSDTFDPEQGWIGLLLAQQEAIQVYELNSYGKLIELYVNPIKKLYYCEDELENLALCFSGNDKPKQQLLSEQQLQSLILEQNLKPLPLSNLLWYGAFISSKGRVMKGLQANDIIHLKRWPDISLPGSRKLIKLAAFMQSNAVDLETIQQQTGIPMDHVNNFVNACSVIGLIEYCQEAEVHEKNLDDSQRQLLARIGKRLKQAENDQ